MVVDTGINGMRGSRWKKEDVGKMTKECKWSVIRYLDVALAGCPVTSCTIVD